MTGHPGHAVAQDQAAFGVGVVHLDGLAAVQVQDVVGPGGVGADAVLCQAKGSHDGGVGGGPRGGGEGSQHRGGAAHVALHAGHVLLALQGQAAGVVDDALADPADPLPGVVGLVAQQHQRGSVVGGLADAVQSAQALLDELGALDDVDFAARRSGHLTRLFHKGAGAELAGGHVDQPGGQSHTLGGDQQVAIGHRAHRRQALEGDRSLLGGPRAAAVEREGPGRCGHGREGVSGVIQGQDQRGVSRARALGQARNGPAAGGRAVAAAHLGQHRRHHLAGADPGAGGRAPVTGAQHHPAIAAAPAARAPPPEGERAVR